MHDRVKPLGSETHKLALVSAQKQRPQAVRLLDGQRFMETLTQNKTLIAIPVAANPGGIPSCTKFV